MSKFWVVKRGGLYLTAARVFRSGQSMAWRFCCFEDARFVAHTLDQAEPVRVRRRATEPNGEDK